MDNFIVVEPLYSAIWRKWFETAQSHTTGNAVRVLSERRVGRIQVNSRAANSNRLVGTFAFDDRARSLEQDAEIQQQ